MKGNNCIVCGKEFERTSVAQKTCKTLACLKILKKKNNKKYELKLENKVKRLEGKKRYNDRWCKELTEGYIKHQLIQRGFPKQSIKPELIEEKKLLIQLKREIYETRRNIKQH